MEATELALKAAEAQLKAAAAQALARKRTQERWAGADHLRHPRIHQEMIRPQTAPQTARPDIPVPSADPPAPTHHAVHPPQTARNAIRPRTARTKQRLTFNARFNRMRLPIGLPIDLKPYAAPTSTPRAWTPDGRQWMERHHITEIAFYSTNREVFYGAKHWSKGGAELRLPTPTPRGGRPATVGLGGRLDRLGLRPVSPRLARMEDGWVD